MTKITVIPEWFCAQRFLLKINYYFLMKKKVLFILPEKKKELLKCISKRIWAESKKGKMFKAK